ncbi:Gfo/Idh/MocA family oxidoreductase [Arthrobacter sp. Sa2CUA1]|uniref:Inositol 2-dehydrogenase n=1 Tax=Arthrobacter gallicola TaxID=2762225 RepID=A0ABR8UUK1_9MICC|nr:Gfo/Idh/MocA family oxidoreductase [Arthrobacter gallicola]MBD7996218.1 Gfo/Idh/MocA family oxidoreductase [Arthrobacter gallicola]
MNTPLRVAVVGAGRMGADHIDRIHRRINGAEVAAVVDIDRHRAEAAIAHIPGAEAHTDFGQALDRGGIDLVLIATPGFLHEDVLLAALEHRLPTLCEKPLTPDAASAWRVVQAELAAGRQLIQVGFMRRFDAGYRALRRIIEEKSYGELLTLHHQHRNPTTPAGFTNEMIIHDTVVHEFDAVRFFTGEEITSVQVRAGRSTRNAPAGQRDPQLVLMETESGILAQVEAYVNAQFGYQVATQASFETGIVSIGGDTEPYIRSAGTWGGGVTPGFGERFGDAYDLELQDWVDAAARGEIGGPSAWDGYATAACCEAGVKAQASGRIEPVQLEARPGLYSPSVEQAPALNVTV